MVSYIIIYTNVKLICSGEICCKCDQIHIRYPLLLILKPGIYLAFYLFPVPFSKAKEQSLLINKGDTHLVS